MKYIYRDIIVANETFCLHTHIKLHCEAERTASIYHPKTHTRLPENFFCDGVTSGAINDLCGKLNVQCNNVIIVGALGERERQRLVIWLWALVRP